MYVRRPNLHPRLDREINCGELNHWRMHMNMHRAFKNPNVAFASPEELEISSLTAAQKRAVLLQWKNQLRQLLIADDESMLDSRKTAGTNAECLRRVNDSLIRLAV
jgi:hypothetical protein